MGTRDLLQNIIDNFDLQRWKRFFSEKNNKFRPSEESFDYYNTDCKITKSLNDGFMR